MTEVTQICVLDKKVCLEHPADGFKTCLDSVMLAAACPARDGQNILDMGCGVGGASFCLLYRVPACHVKGVDVQPASIDLARVNANNINTKQADFILSDIRAYQPKDTDKPFDHVICNPPFLEGGEHVSSPQNKVATARGHQDAALSLQDWLDKGFECLKVGGSITIIHRADSADRIIQGFGKRFGQIEIIPLWPKQGRQAKRVIIRALKGRKSPAIIHPGLLLHEDNGDYTKAADLILREGQALV